LEAGAISPTVSSAAEIGSPIDPAGPLWEQVERSWSLVARRAGSVSPVLQYRLQHPFPSQARRLSTPDGEFLLQHSVGEWCFQSPDGLACRIAAGDPIPIELQAFSPTSMQHFTRLSGPLTAMVMDLSECYPLHAAGICLGDRMLAVHGRSGTGKSTLAALLASEGLHPIEGDARNVDTLYAAGFRMLGLTHFFDNEVAGSAHGVARGGLTPLGRDVVRRMEAVSILVDVAHASPKAVDDVLAMATRPVVVSHGGVQATCPGPRNLTDDQLRRIAATGGVVGIGYWDGAVCAIGPASTARAIVHAAGVAGIDHVALGSDFDGATTTPFDAAGLAQVTQALLDAGMAPADIAKVMGGNVLRLLRATLPAR
jgi:microsomal dipeptidase-like Zn-dependent dipeptidase